MSNKKKIREEQIMPGLLSCQGCGATIAMRMVLRVLGAKTIVIVPACCWTIIAGNFPYSAFKIPALHVAFETAGATASGISRAMKSQGKSDINVLAWAGDGGTFDIGLQSLSGAAERGENIIYVCYDNEAYMNTGIQRSSATPQGAWTTTTPVNILKEHPKKDMMAIMAAHEIPYAATLSIAYPEDLERKVNRAKNLSGQGLRYLHVLSPCPSGWRSEPSKTVELARLAVQTGIFPLFEMENIKGKKRTIINEVGNLPLGRYISGQGRFDYLTLENMKKIKETAEARLAHLRNLEKLYK